MDPIASLFLFFSILFPFNSFATSFGAITLVDQARGSQYVVHGRIVGNGAAAKERTLQVPYTYWKLAVIDQPMGGGLTGEIDIREPGGEVGEMGYHLAGTATFRDGEEVYVALRDTNEGDVKEVVGLASGKYLVEGNTIRSGLGPTIMGPDGSPLSVEEFAQVIRRTASGRQTEQDKTIFVNRAPTFGADDEHSHGPAAGSVSNRRKLADLPVSHAPKETLQATTTDSATNSIKTGPEEPEKSSTGTSGSWWMVALGLAALALVALVLLFRR